MSASFNLLTTTDAARQLGVSPDAILRYYRSGILRGRKQGRLVLVEQNAVLSLMKVIKWAREGKPTSLPNLKNAGGVPEASPATTDNTVSQAD